MTRRKVLAIGAHDDDVFIGTGGLLLKRHEDDDIRVLVLTSGQNSHVVVLGEHEHPTPAQVAEAREAELENALDILKDEKFHRTWVSRTQLGYPDTCGALTAARQEVEKEIEDVFVAVGPDIVYFQTPDAHEDHRLAHHAMATVLKKIGFKGEAYTYAIWTKELALMRPEVDVSMIEDFTGEAEMIDVRDVLSVKRDMLHQFASQVQLWPYSDWPVQRAPILDKDFLDYFLRGEEVIMRYCVK